MRKSLAITMVALFACTLIGNAAPKKGPTPVITKVVADVWTATVFIEGQDFDLNAKVSWGRDGGAIDELVVLSISDSLITAVLTTTLPGTYLLLVQNPGKQTFMDVTIGAVGPAGPQGIQGLQGPMGPTGQQGPVGPAGADGGLRVLDALDQEVGVVLSSTLVARFVNNRWVSLPVLETGFHKVGGITFMHDTSDCSGTRYLPATLPGPLQLPIPGFYAADYLSREAQTVDGVTFFYPSGSFVQITQIAREDIFASGAPPTCHFGTGGEFVLVAGSFDLSAFAFLPPFRIVR